MTTKDLQKDKEKEKKVARSSHHPSLRFGEFTDDWEEKRLGEIGNFLGGGTPSKKISKYWSGNIPWISSSDLSEDNFFVNVSKFITKEALEKSATKIIPKNSLLIISRVGVGKLAIADRDICTSQDFTNFLPRKNIDLLFSAYTLKTKIKNLLSFQQGTSIKGFTKSDLETLKIKIPSLPEQEKIASFLGGVDDWLGNLKKQKEELEKYKKGIMQQIFPAKDQKTPSLRFPVFSGEWEEKKLGELLDYEQPTQYIVDDTNYDDEFKTPVLTAGKTFILGYTNEEVGIFDAKNDPVIIFDDFTTAKKFVDFKFKVKSSAMKILKNKDDGISDIRFIFPAMTRIKFGLGAEHKRFWISEYSKIKINLPPLPEQEKIASFLTSLDDIILSTEQKITALEKWKKGLMQKMFV